MGNWSKVPTLQIAASSEKTAWQERKTFPSIILWRSLIGFGGAAFSTHYLCCGRPQRSAGPLLSAYPLSLFPLHFLYFLCLYVALNLSQPASYSLQWCWPYLTVWWESLCNSISGVIFVLSQWNWTCLCFLIFIHLLVCLSLFVVVWFGKRKGHRLRS